MDLLNLDSYLLPDNIKCITHWGDDWAWLGGGTWLFSEAQPQVKVLVDTQHFGWSEIEVTQDYLVIGASCPLVKLLDYPWLQEWRAVTGFKAAVSALAASLKVINMATVGGNICLALSVGTLAPLMVALDAIYEVWNLQGESFPVAAKDFQLGSRHTVLKSGEILRRVLIPLSHLQWAVNYQRFSLASTDSALAIVVTVMNHQQVRCVIGASVPAPRLFEFADLTTMQSQVSHFLADEFFIDDAMASANYRREMTAVLIHKTVNLFRAQTQRVNG
ncbi:xanthine dehydrogenase family protein subunit M [Anabaena sp. 4-3]|uniref:FAD binding domain-containing protein n=1 Tax=Anabaena sp. 4-3 TaxID=1811979 RepID=UPI00082A2ABB|nr:FAD binding domain-containing protein [Anabaena sp. 4-3]